MQGVTPHATAKTSEGTLCTKTVSAQLPANALNDFKLHEPDERSTHRAETWTSTKKATMTIGHRHTMTPTYYIEHDKQLFREVGKAKGGPTKQHETFSLFLAAGCPQRVGKSSYSIETKTRSSKRCRLQVCSHRLCALSHGRNTTGGAFSPKGGNPRSERLCVCACACACVRACAGRCVCMFLCACSCAHVRLRVIVCAWACACRRASVGLHMSMYVSLMLCTCEVCVCVCVSVLASL